MTRRSIVAAISICIHAIMLIALMTADLWRPISEWPTPRSAMAFIDPPRPVEIERATPAKVIPRQTPGPPPPAIELGRHADLAPIAPPGASAIPEDAGAAAQPPGESEREGHGSIGVNGFGPASGAPPPRPAPAPAPQEPVRLHTGIRAPQRIVSIQPIYPAIARSAHVEGVVIIEATLDERGNVVRTELLRSIPLLDDAALTAVRQWKFSPTLLNGVPVPIVMTVTVHFSLQ